MGKAYQNGSVGITTEGEREVLGFSVGIERIKRLGKPSRRSEKRGVKEIGVWVSDGSHYVQSCEQISCISRQRCVVHKMENVLSYVPNKQREQIEPELKALFYKRIERQPIKRGSIH